MTPARRLLLVLFLAACGGAGGSTGDRATAPLKPTTRDSAGITIYEHPADALERAPLVTMDSRPIGVIGSDDPDDDVSAVQFFEFLSDMRTVAFDMRTGSLNIYSREGDLERRVGRRGQGPGEFSGVRWIAVLPGDSVVVSDGGTSRVSIVAPDSGMVRNFSAPLAYSSAGLGAGVRLRDGSWALLPVSYGLDGKPDQGRPRYGVLRQRETDGLELSTDTLAYVLGIETRTATVSVRGQSRQVRTPERFFAYGLTQAFDSGFVMTPNDRYLVRMFGADGAVRAEVTMIRPRQAVGDSIIDAAIREELARMRAPGAEQTVSRDDELEANARARPSADSLPAFARLYSTPSLLWLADYTNPAVSEQGYTALDRDGRVVGRLLLPRGTRVEAFGPNRILLRTEDDDGIVRFEIHRLHMPE